MDFKKIEYQCIILAAGCGRRISGITNKRPKSLLRVNNKSLLEYHLDNLLENNIRDVTLIVGFEKEQIIKHLKNKYKDLSISLVYSEEYDSTNHSWSLFISNKIVRKINKPVLVTHADTYYEPRLLNLLLDSTFQNLILVDSDFSINTNDELVVFGNNNIVSNLEYINNDCSSKIVGEFVGLHKFSYNFTISFFDFLEKYFLVNGRDDGYDWLIGKYINQTKKLLHYQTIDNIKWINVNHEADYNYAKKIFENL
tara:strand:- start:17547 stop:18308 length:762 start_codon:yes stop_codon:yes gene_type:complete